MEESVIEEADPNVLESQQHSEAKGDKSHLIVWQVSLV